MILGNKIALHLHSHFWGSSPFISLIPLGVRTKERKLPLSSQFGFWLCRNKSYKSFCRNFFCQTNHRSRVLQTERKLKDFFLESVLKRKNEVRRKWDQFLQLSKRGAIQLGWARRTKKDLFVFAYGR